GGRRSGCGSFCAGRCCGCISARSGSAEMRVLTQCSLDSPRRLLYPWISGSLPGEPLDSSSLSVSAHFLSRPDEHFQIFVLTSRDDVLAAGRSFRPRSLCHLDELEGGWCGTTGFDWRVSVFVGLREPAGGGAGRRCPGAGSAPAIVPVLLARDRAAR